MFICCVLFRFVQIALYVGDQSGKMTGTYIMMNPSELCLFDGDFRIYSC